MYYKGWSEFVLIENYWELYSTKYTSLPFSTLQVQKAITGACKLFTVGMQSYNSHCVFVCFRTHCTWWQWNLRLSWVTEELFLLQTQQNFNGFMKKWSEQLFSFFLSFTHFFCLMCKVIITDLYIATIHSCSSIIWLTTKSLSVLLTLTNGQLDIQLGSKPSPDGDTAEQTKVLAAKMGNLVILRKGHVDTISDGNRGQFNPREKGFPSYFATAMHHCFILLYVVVECCELGCPRRCGGQGDLLSGTVGLFSHWARQSKQLYAPTVYS